MNKLIVFVSLLIFLTPIVFAQGPEGGYYGEGGLGPEVTAPESSGEGIWSGEYGNPIQPGEFVPESPTGTADPSSPWNDPYYTGGPVVPEANYPKPPETINPFNIPIPRGGGGGTSSGGQQPSRPSTQPSKTPQQPTQPKPLTCDQIGSDYNKCISGGCDYDLKTRKCTTPSKPKNPNIVTSSVPPFTPQNPPKQPQTPSQPQKTTTKNLDTRLLSSGEYVSSIPVSEICNSQIFLVKGKDVLGKTIFSVDKEVKFKPKSSGTVKIVAFCLDPVKVYKDNVQVNKPNAFRSLKLEPENPVLACSLTTLGLQCGWNNCQVKNSAELTFAQKPDFIQSLPINDQQGSLILYRVFTGKFTVLLTCENGETFLTVDA